MRHISVLDRILLFVAGLLASYQVVQGIEGLGTWAVTCYTIGFGILLVASLLIIIFGFEILDSPLVAIISSIIPLSLSLGLVSQYLGKITGFYLLFVVTSFAAIVISRFAAPGKTAVFILSVVHAISGLLIFGLPIVFSLQRITPAGFALVGLGGGLMGIGGLLLSLLKTGNPILSGKTILAILPGLLLLTTAAFAAGFAFI